MVTRKDIRMVTIIVPHLKSNTGGWTPYSWFFFSIRSISHDCYRCPWSLHHKGISSHTLVLTRQVGPYPPWGTISTTCVISAWNSDVKCRYIFFFFKTIQHIKGQYSIPNALQVNSLAPGRSECDPKSMIFNLVYWLVSSDLLMIMASDECHRTLLMISQHWFR